MVKGQEKTKAHVCHVTPGRHKQLADYTSSGEGLGIFWGLSREYPDKENLDPLSRQEPFP